MIFLDFLDFEPKKVPSGPNCIALVWSRLGQALVGWRRRNSRKKFCPFLLLGGWVGGRVGGVQEPARPLGVGHFWVPGFSQSLGGWVSQISPTLPPVIKKNLEQHPLV